MNNVENKQVVVVKEVQVVALGTVTSLTLGNGRANIEGLNNSRNRGCF